MDLGELALGLIEFVVVLTFEILVIAILALAIALVIFCAFSIFAKAMSKTPPSFWKIYKYTFPIFLLAVVYFAQILAQTPGAGRADASNIITDLRNMKAAALMYRADGGEKLALMENHVGLLLPYFDNKEKITNGMYAFRAGAQYWWVGFNLKKEDQHTRSGLLRRAGTFGLYGSPRLDAPPSSPRGSSMYKEGDGAVWLVVTPTVQEVES